MAADQLRLLISIESESGFIPMFQGGGARRALPRRLRAARAPVRVMATIIVATSSPPFAEGGHLVMARELVRALEECGHAATLLVTPQNRFGRQGSAYLAAWCTDVSRGARGQPVDQVISLRYPAYAVRHDRHVVWLNHRMREYYDLWDQFAAALVVARARSRSVRAARIIHRVDRHLLTKRVQRLLRDLGDGPGAARSSGAASRPRCCTRRRPCARIATMATATTSSRSRD